MNVAMGEGWVVTQNEDRAFHVTDEPPLPFTVELRRRATGRRARRERVVIGPALPIRLWAPAVNDRLLVV